MGSGGSTTVKSNSVLTLDSKTFIIDSPIEDQEDFLNLNVKDKKVLIYDILDAINRAKTDDNIKGISIESDMITAGMTQLDDIRAALEDFKKSGKFVYAYGNNVSQSSYYLGSVADQYYLNPAGGIELKGMSTEVAFFKKFTEKYGIGVDVIRHGKFKSAVEPFLRDDMSPENKEQISTLINDIWKVNVAKMATSRKIDSAQFRVIVDSLYGVIPDNTVKYKLADKLMQKTEYENIIKAKLSVSVDKDLNKISFSKYIKSYKTEGTSKENQVAVLYASGGIYNGEGYDAIYAEDFKEHIKELAVDDKVKAVVFRINSPGGSANASDEILFELEQLKKKKPLIVSFGDYAASGGYYVAMGADKIFSEPNTITGSIGVFGVIPNFKELVEKNGIRSDVVNTNENSNFYSPLNGLSDGAHRVMTQSVETVYKRFVYFVTKNRNKSFEQIDAVGGGRVWSGTRAKEIGLVDELGTVNDAIKFAAQKAGLKDYNTVSYPKKVSAFEQFMKDLNEDEIEARVIKNKLGTENFKIYETLSNPNVRNGVMMELPFKVSF